MNTIFYRRLGFISFILGISAILAGCHEHHIEVRINPDGSCLVTAESVLSRIVVGQQVRMMSAFIKRSGKKYEGLDPELLEESQEDDKQPDSHDKSETENETLKKRIFALSKALYGERWKISAVDIKENDVRITTRTEYQSLARFFEDPKFAYDLGYDGMRLESKENATATLTLYGDSGHPGNLKQRLKAASSQDVSGSLKFILPGKIVESPLDHMEDNATWSTLHSTDRNTYTQKLFALDEDIVITFEQGGLSLSGVLDSEQARRLSAEATKIGGSTPLTQASEGYFGEAMSVTTTRIIPFPGREAFSGNIQGHGSRQTEGIVVYARLYAPRGRHFLAMHSLKVLEAKDDNNRRLPLPDKDLSDADRYFDFREHEKSVDQLDVTVRLHLPDYPLNAIETMELESEVVTCGKWQSHRIPGNSLNAGETYDLSVLFEKGRLVTKRLDTSDAYSGEIVIELTGAGNPDELKFAVELPGRRFSTQTSDDTGNEEPASKRLVRLNYYSYGSPIKSDRRPDLVINRPTDVKREMVRFKLSEIDLF